MIRIDFLAGFLVFVGIVVAVVAVVEQPGGREFSAEIVDLGPTSHGLTGRIYAGKDKLRLESINGASSTVTIQDFARNTLHVLDPQKMTYFEFPFPVSEFRNGDFYTHSRDKPCGAAYRATRVGSEAVNGRMAEKWRCEIKQLPKYMENINKDHLRMVFVIDPWHIWYDVEHSLMVRYVRYDGDGRELQNVRMEPQPDDLFVVPPGYTEDKSPLGDVLGSMARR